MQRIIMVVVAVTGLTGGLLGAVAVSQLSEKAGAAPPAQARESVFSLIAGKFVEVGGPSTGEWVDLRDSDSVFRLTLDASRYPTGSTFRLELTGSHITTDPVGTGCVRLAEVAGASRTPIEGSDVCSSSGGPLFASGGSFSIPAGQHIYTLQVQSTAQGGFLRLTAARVIAEWTERR